MTIRLLSRSDKIQLISRGESGRDGIGYLGARERPGDVLALFSSSLSGKAEALAPFASGQIVTTDGGSVLRVPSASDPVIIASRQDFAVEEGQVYAARWVTRRFQNTSDPYGDAVEYRLAWLDASKAFISTVVADKRALVVNDGRYAFQATFSRDLDADITAPVGARYVRPYVRLLGGNGVTDVEVVSRWETTGLPGPKGADGAEPEYFLNEDAETIRWRQADGTIGPALDIGSARKKAEAAAALAEDFAGDTVAQGSVPIFASRSTASTYNLTAFRSVIIDRDVTASRLAPAKYEKVDAEPTHAAKFQDSTGQWFELAEAVPSVAMFGSVQDAVAFAFAKGVELYWPGDFAAVGNVPNFHLVTHRGPGRLTRNGKVWFIEPKSYPAYHDENTLYYDLSGSDTNDGLSPEFARRTLTQFRVDLRDYNRSGKYLSGQWIFAFGPGTWTGGRVRLNFDVVSAQPIRLVGTKGDRGHEIVSYGGFGLASAWQTPAGVTIGGNQALFSGGGGFRALLQSVPPLIGLEAGATYEVKFEVSGRTAGIISPRLGSSTGTDVTGPASSSNGSFTVQMVATAGTDQIKFTADDAFNGALRNVSVKKVTAAGEGGPATFWQITVAPLGWVAWADAGNYLVDNIGFLGANAASTTYGWLQQSTTGFTELTNCYAQDASIGLAAIDGVRINTNKCLTLRCRTGYRAHYGSKMSFGNADPANANRALESEFGAFISRNAIGHIDYFVVDDATQAAVVLETGAPRANLIACDFRRCSVGVDPRSHSEWIATDINYNMGTPDACGIPFRHSGGAAETRLYAQQSQTEHRVAYSRTAVTHTGTTAQTTIIRAESRTRFNLPAYFFTDPGKRMRIRVWGVKAGTAGSLSILAAVTNQGTVTNKQTIASAVVGTAAGDFVIEFEISPLTFVSQKQSSVMWRSGANPVVNPASSRGASMAVDREVRIDATLGNAADSVVIEGYDVFLMG